MQNEFVHNYRVDTYTSQIGGHELVWISFAETENDPTPVLDRQRALALKAGCFCQRLFLDAFPFVAYLFSGATHAERLADIGFKLHRDIYLLPVGGGYGGAFRGDTLNL